MKNFKKILCPTDFSEASYEAVKMANDLAEHFSAQLTLVHVVQPVIPLPDVEIMRSFDVVTYEYELRKGMENKLADVARNMISKTVQVQSKTLCCGDPAKMICDLAESENVDLIVIATHGMTGWRHYAHGSVAQKVIHLTMHPVLLVRGKPGEK
jgi:universal stress protein A